LSSHSPNNTKTTAIFLNDYFADMWTHLDEALAGERTAFEALKGAPFFEWLAQHPHEARRFDRMMLEVHGPETPAIVAAYDFSPFAHAVDVGGGNGSLLSAVLAANPKLHPPAATSISSAISCTTTRIATVSAFLAMCVPPCSRRDACWCSRHRCLPTTVRAPVAGSICK
jgi:hypothetical protein